MKPEVKVLQMKIASINSELMQLREALADAVKGQSSGRFFGSGLPQLSTRLRPFFLAR